MGGAFRDARLIMDESGGIDMLLAALRANGRQTGTYSNLEVRYGPRKRARNRASVLLQTLSRAEIQAVFLATTQWEGTGFQGELQRLRARLHRENAAPMDDPVAESLADYLHWSAEPVT